MTSSGVIHSQEEPVSMSQALGQSDSFLECQEQISRVAPVERPVVLLGERGTGKELAAARLHFLSRRWQKPLVTLNCAVLTPTLIGSELFGYEKGAFTGAGTRQTGRFEQADGGTLFLDEIGTIPVEVQEKILRVVEYGRFERVGASRPVQVDVRMVAAANVDLARMAKEGKFKQDLLDRLSFEVIHLPPLRSRKEDILLLANHFAGRMAFELGWRQMPELASEAVNALESYPWPGNVRELKNVVERAVYRSSSPRITQISFDPFSSPHAGYPGMEKSDKHPGPGESPLQVDAPVLPGTGLPTRELSEKPLKEAVAVLERHRLAAALESARFNQKKAARLLGLTYDQFRGVKKRHGM